MEKVMGNNQNMKVKDLIKALQECDPEAEVLFTARTWGGRYEEQTTTHQACNVVQKTQLEEKKKKAINKVFIEEKY